MTVRSIEEGPWLSARVTARPVRIAYLIEIEQSPGELLDAIFDEAYSRWGGRRTLIVPSAKTGIDSRYEQWLKLYDPDIIYSYVALDDGAVQDINEKFCPAYLVPHRDRHLRSGDPPDYRPSLPFQALSSLSVVPAMIGRNWGPFERVSYLRILDKFFDRSESPFLRENFGFISSSYHNSLVAEAAPDVLKCATLILQSSLDSGYLRKSSIAEYFTDELQILAAMAKPSPLATLSELSDVLAPHLQTDSYGDSQSLNLVVGDGADDRLLFWNGQHRYGHLLSREITSLRVSPSKCEDEKFLGALTELIRHRGRMHQGHHNVLLSSCSLPVESLNGIASVVTSGGLISVQVAAQRTHVSCIPRFREQEQFIGYSYGSITPPKTTTEATFQGNDVRIPSIMPWHLSEARPPAPIRNGRWMIDLSIDRLNDHSRFSNLTHHWVLPRRLRIQNAFNLSRNDSLSDFSTNFVRTNRFGLLSLTASFDAEPATITVPEDIDAFRRALCTEREWEPFGRGRKVPVSFNRYRYAEPSDKGRYLLAVLEHFSDVPTAFEFLMNGYWRDVFLHLGGISPERSRSLQEELKRTLKKRLSPNSAQLVISNEDHWDRLTRVALQFGRKVQKERRFVPYGFLKSKWELLVRRDSDGSSHLSEEDKEYYLKDFHLDRSIQALCDAKVLFQGREWTCRKCFNKNWVSIEAITRTLVCEVCSDTRSAPVSGDWAFRINDFVLEAYRDHGAEPVIWTLWRLSERARSSFYFAPSLSLWDEYPEKGDARPIAEIDALAVVDGTLYLCEAKAGSRFGADQLQQLATICSRVRPDVLLVACMDENAEIEQRVQNLAESIQATTRVEIIRFDPAALEEGSMLPS